MHVVDKKGVYTPEFYLIKHFSHFVKRDAKYLHLKGEYSSCCSEFKNSDGEIVIIASNPYESERVITVQESSYVLPPRSINTITV